MKAAKNVRQNKGVVHWSSTNTKNKTNELNVLEAFFGKIGKSSKKNKKSEINLKESHIKHYCNKTSNVYEMKITKITDIS